MKSEFVRTSFNLILKRKAAKYKRKICNLIDLIEWCLTPFSTVFQLYRGGQCTNPCSPGVLLTSTPHNILSKPLAAFPHDHCPNNGQR